MLWWSLEKQIPKTKVPSSAWDGVPCASLSLCLSVSVSVSLSLSLSMGISIYIYILYIYIYYTFKLASVRTRIHT